MFKSLKTLSICSLLILSSAVSAQQSYQNPEDKIEIDPTQIYPQLVVNKAWKQKVTLIKGRDTLDINRFDGQGRKIYTKSFYEGRPESITTYTHSKDGKTWSWRSNRLKNKTVWTSKTTYLSPGVPLQFYNMDYNAKGDTVASQRALFSYDAAGNLLQRSDFTAGRLTIQRKYRYKGKLMIEMTSQMTGSISKKRMQYRYDVAGNLIESKEFYEHPKENTLMKTVQYVWKNGKLAEKISKEEIGEKRTFHFSYSYDAKGRLSAYTAKSGTNFKEAKFLYEGDHLKKITMGFNSNVSFPDALPIWNAGAFTGTMVYQKIFDYNEKGDLVKVEDFYGTRLQNSWSYEFSY